MWRLLLLLLILPSTGTAQTIQPPPNDYIFDKDLFSEAAFEASLVEISLMSRQELEPLARTLADCDAALFSPDLQKQSICERTSKYFSIVQGRQSPIVAALWGKIEVAAKLMRMKESQKKADAGDTQRLARIIAIEEKWAEAIGNQFQRILAFEGARR